MSEKPSEAVLVAARKRAGRATVRHRAAIPAGSACRPRRHARIPGRKNKPSRKNKPGRTNQTKETKPREKPREKEQPVHPDEHTLKRRELSGFQPFFIPERPPGRRESYPSYRSGLLAGTGFFCFPLPPQVFPFFSLVPTIPDNSDLP